MFGNEKRKQTGEIGNEMNRAIQPDEKQVRGIEFDDRQKGLFGGNVLHGGDPQIMRGSRLSCELSARFTL